MSKPVVSSYLPWQANPADWNPSLGLVTQVCAGYSRTWALHQPRSEICITPVSSPPQQGWLWPRQHAEMRIWWLRSSSDLGEHLVSVWTECVWTCGAQFHVKTQSSGKTFWQMPFSFCEMQWFLTLFIQKAACYHTGNPGFVFLPLLRTCYLFSWFLDSWSLLFLPNAHCIEELKGNRIISNLNPACPIFICIVEKDCGFGNCKPLSQEHKADIDF